MLAPSMAVAAFRDGQWRAYEIRRTGAIELHPAAHDGSAVPCDR